MARSMINGVWCAEVDEQLPICRIVSKDEEGATLEKPSTSRGVRCSDI